MKQTKKNKLKEKKEREKIRKEKEKQYMERQIINTISNQQIVEIKDFNLDTFSFDRVNKESMIECLRVLFEIIINSNYIDEILEMTKKNISTAWFDREVDKEFIKERLLKELNDAKTSSNESIALKICFWANRIAHYLENEVIQKQPKHRANEIYIKYFLNPKYHYDICEARHKHNGECTPEIEEILSEILIKAGNSVGDIDTVEKLNNLFRGLTIRNELWTLKQQMIKYIFLNISKNNNSTVKVTYLKEKSDLSISGSETLRLIIREINGIAPVVMHCDKAEVEAFLLQNSIGPIDVETDEKIIQFAQNGKVGIHFILDSEDKEILEYESEENAGARMLMELLYKGDDEDGR